MQASILRSDYGDILGIETLQVIDEFIDAATNLCQKVSQNSSTSREPGEPQSSSSESLQSESDVELPEVVLEFHRWAQGPPPSWLQEFEEFHAKLRLAASASSVTETDSELEQFRRNLPKRAASESSVTETDTDSFEKLCQNAPKRVASVTGTDTDFRSNVFKRASASESSVTETDSELEQFRPNAPKQAASESSVTETDTD